MYMRLVSALLIVVGQVVVVVGTRSLLSSLAPSHAMGGDVIDHLLQHDVLFGASRLESVAREVQSECGHSGFAAQHGVPVRLVILLLLLQSLRLPLAFLLLSRCALSHRCGRSGGRSLRLSLVVVLPVHGILELLQRLRA